MATEQHFVKPEEYRIEMLEKFAVGRTAVWCDRLGYSENPLARREFRYIRPITFE
jgi:hypothetical protein